MNPDKPVALVLGGTTPHAALIEILKQRGYFTVLVDYYENPPAKKVVDEHVRASTLDVEVVLEIARGKNASLVISACVDQANVTACYVAEKLGLPVPYSYETAVRMSNKLLMKKGMLEHGIPTTKFRMLGSDADVRCVDLAFPVVVKPADSNGSKGVKRADSLDELMEFSIYARSVSRTGEIIVEEYFDGREVNVYCFVKDRRAQVIMTCQKYNKISGRGCAIQCYSTIIPATLSKPVHRRIGEIAQKIATGFGLVNTSLLIQVLVRGDVINVIEFAPRVGGGLSFRTIVLKTGIDLVDATVDTYLGDPEPVVVRDTGRLLATNHLYALPCRFGEISGIEALISDGIIEGYYPNKTRGMEITSEMASRDRVGSFIVCGSSDQELLSRIKQAMDRLDVFDVDGRPVLRRDICLQSMDGG